MNSISDKIPKVIKEVLNRLETNGFEAYLVGGAVRDILMDTTPGDYDVCSSASTDEVKALFPKHFALGEKFGTISVIASETDIVEITTFRKDSTYSDGRRPDAIEFTSDVVEDLARRDFTINAIAYSPKRGLVDPFDGRKAINDQIIQTVGKAENRFSEDGLRIFRAIRFASRLGFEIEEETNHAMRSCIDNLINVANERFSEELIKILRGAYVEEVVKTHLDILYFVLPELDDIKDCEQNTPYHCYDLLTHTLKVVKHIRDDKTLKLAAFFHDFGKPYTKTTDDNGIDHFYGHPEKSREITRQILKRLKFENKIIHQVTTLIKYHDDLQEPSLRNIKKLIGAIGYELFDKLIELRQADMAAQAPREDLSIIKAIELRNQVEEQNAALSRYDLAINGKEIMAELNVEGSPLIGKIIDQLLDLVIDEVVDNNKESLMIKAKAIYQTLKE